MDFKGDIGIDELIDGRSDGLHEIDAAILPRETGLAVFQED